MYTVIMQRGEMPLTNGDGKAIAKQFSDIAQAQDWAVQSLYPGVRAIVVTPERHVLEWAMSVPDLFDAAIAGAEAVERGNHESK